MQIRLLPFVFLCKIIILMIGRTMNKYTLLLPAFLVLASPNVSAGKLYKWIDKDGKVRYSDQVPGEAVKRGRKELSGQGTVVDEQGRALTPEEKAERDRKIAAEKNKAKQDESRIVAYKDILKLYSDMQFLDNAYKVRFEALDTAISLSEDRIKSMTEDRENILQRVLIIEKSNPRVPQKFYDRIEKLDNGIMEQSRIITEKKQEIIDTKNLHQVKRSIFLEAKKWAEENRY